MQGGSHSYYSLFFDKQARLHLAILFPNPDKIFCERRAAVRQSSQESTMILPKRDDPVVVLPDGERERVGWWYSPTAYIVKWTVVLSLFLLFFLWVTLGYLHARRRLRNGLKPLAYHRWLVPRSYRPQLPQNNYAYYRPGAYGMQDQRMETLPVYSSADMPPSYQPPPGGTKVAPYQEVREMSIPAPAYERTQETTLQQPLSDSAPIGQQHTGTVRSS